MKVKDLMTPSVVTLAADDPLIAAEEIMGLRGFRHMPVVEPGEKLVGMLSRLDIVRKVLEGDEGDHRQQAVKKASVRVRDIMHSRLDTLSPDDDLAAAARKMRKTRHACFPVVDDGRLVGVLTEADFVMMVADLIEHAVKTDSAWADGLAGKLKNARG